MSHRRSVSESAPQHGSTVVVYPEGVWYVGVHENDVAEIFSAHILGGRPVDRLIDRRYV